MISLIVLLVGCGKNSIENERRAAADSAGSDRTAGEKADLDPVRGLEDLISRQDWASAGQQISAALISQPDNPAVLTNAALVNAKLGNLREAAQLMVSAATASGFDINGPRVDYAIKALIDVGQLYDAIDLLEQVVLAHPTSAKYRRILVGFLGEAQLNQQMSFHVERLIRDRQFDMPILTASTETFTRRFSEVTIETMLKRNPADQRPRLGLAQQMLENRDADAAKEILAVILQAHPDFAPAHAMMGQVLVDNEEFGELAAWLGDSPTGSAQFGDYWLSLGDLANHFNDLPVAVRAYSEATKKSPNSTLAWSRLGESLRRLRQGSAADQKLAERMPEWFATQDDVFNVVKGIDNRYQSLLELRKRFHEFSGTSKRSQKAAVAVAEKLFDLGRVWEAEAWSAIATTLTDDLAPNLTEQRQQILAALVKNRSWVDEPRFAELKFDFTTFPLPKIQSIATRKQTGGSIATVTRSNISLPLRLVDEAAKRGIQFFGKAGDRVNGPHVPLSQTLGCGGASIDFDNDGKTDLFFRSAGGAPQKRDSSPGAMFRNLDGRFSDVSLSSNVWDTGFGQGVAAGDYNDDGFTDLFLLNLGENSLYRNNGDGTFTDVSSQAFSNLPSNWSSSGGVVDVDGDGFNDLIAINYCEANDLIDKPCFDEKTKEPVTCHPLQFAGSKDEFFKGRGDGTFVEMSDQWTQQPSPGRGLGIIAGKLDGKQMGIYVANDMSANDYYIRQGAGDDFSLSNVATSAGIAVDAQTLAQASMGIATSDFDNDGDLDFYVTGFAREYNVLYEQEFPGSWSDNTAKLALVKPTLSMVGFGTVANDLDGDCIDELLVTNGHIGDFGGDAPPYAQPFQMFRRTTSGLFEEENTAQWKGYFEQRHVGRAMWTIDVDSDGRSDTVVTHETEPVSLLINHSEQGNQFVGFRLVGTSANRDAVGSIVEFEVPLATGKISKTLYMLAGTGYLCSSESVLRSGTGDAKAIENVTVRWPSGEAENFGSLPAHREYLIVEKEGIAIELKSFE